MVLTPRVDVIALRATPGRANERVTEALLGEPLEVSGSEDAAGDPWVRVRGADGYAGWAPRRALVEWSKPSSERIVHTRLARVENETGEARMLSLGCRVDAVEDDRVRLPDGVVGRLDTLGLSPFYAPDGDLATRAGSWLGVAYRWGGRSVHGVDCSGLVQHLVAPSAPDVPRDAWEQEAWAGRGWGAVDRGDIRRGDLLFWGRERATHVGVALGTDGFVHAREWVRTGRWREGEDRDLAALFRGAYRPPGGDA